LTPWESLPFPKAIRQLPAEVLPQLCEALKQHMQSSKPPGFERAMAAVELTVALHRIFRNPYDAILFEEASLALAHRLLTGHVPGFLTPLQAQALPHPQDLFDTSHGPAALAQALGLLEGRRRCAHGGRVVVVLEEEYPLYRGSLEALCREGAAQLPWLGLLLRRGGGGERGGGPFLALEDLKALLGGWGISLWPLLGATQDIGGLEGVLRRAKAAHKPLLIHLQLSELPEGAAPLRPPGMEAKLEVLRSLMEADARVVLLASPPLPPSEWEGAFPGRIWRLASSIEHRLGFAAGLLQAGLKPIVLHAALPGVEQREGGPYAAPPGFKQPGGGPYAAPPGFQQPGGSPYASPPGFQKPGGSPYAAPPGVERWEGGAYAVLPGLCGVPLCLWRLGEGLPEGALGRPGIVWAVL